MIIAFIIGFLIFLGARIGFGYISGESEAFAKWYLVLDIAAGVFAFAFVLALIFYFIKKGQEIKWKRAPREQREEAPAPVQSDVRIVREEQPQNKWQDRKNRKAERREQRAQRAASRQAQRDKVFRVESFEKRWRR